MIAEESLKTTLEKHLKLEYLEIINESHLHLGHSGDNGSGQTHFKLIIVSSAFQGLTRTQRHRLVYSYIKPDAHSIHALSIKTLTLEEWKHPL